MECRCLSDEMATRTSRLKANMSNASRKLNADVHMDESGRGQLARRRVSVRWAMQAAGAEKVATKCLSEMRA